LNEETVELVFEDEEDEETRLQEKENNKIIQTVVHDFILDLGEKTINRVIKEEEEMMKDVVSEYLMDMNWKIADQLAQIEAEPKPRARKSKLLRVDSVKNVPVRKDQELDLLINEKVEEKLQLLLPGLIEIVTKGVE